MKKLYNERPLLLVMLAAILPRLIAAVFAKGYGMHDDHFGPIEQPFLILTDPAFWENRGNPHGHSIIYPALHYYLFKFLNSISITDPQHQMTVVRLIHGAYSLIYVYFGYKIALIIGSKSAAFKTGMLLALLWILPYMSVRNLIEMVCIPPAIAAFYFILRDKKLSDTIMAGVLFALAFIPRYHTAIFPMAVFLVFVYNRQFLRAVILALSAILTVFLTQGLVDWAAWGYPLAAPLEYFIYNTGHSGDYTTGPWYQYLALYLGILIPPTSIMLISGMFSSWKRPLLYLPFIIFFIFHSIFPNKQERFILPVLPLSIILGVYGLDYLKDKFNWLENIKTTRKILWIWFWAINSILLLLSVTSYSKRSRVEAMSYLYDKKDLKGVYIEGGKLGSIKPPLFYAGKNIPAYTIKPGFDKIKNENDSRKGIKPADEPNYVVFYGKENINERVKNFEKYFSSELVFEAEIEPSLIDDILYELNPEHNKNQTGYIYKRLKK